MLAQVEARELKHNYIGTEHLLLGLLREEEGVGSRVIESLGVTLEGVRGQVARIVGEGDEVTSGQIPFTPRAKKVLELALREALSLGHNYIGTEHLLLGLVREDEGVGSRILLDFGADADTIRDAVVRTLGITAPTGAIPRPGHRRLSSPRRMVARAEPAPSHRASVADRFYRPEHLIAVGWALFGIAAGLGVLVGWLIWG